MRKVVTTAHMPTEFTIENLGENKARISAWPFEIGFGITLAHPLHRLLRLSAIGYAATAIKIDGVSHEFDSKRGMLEDISLFIINIKNMRFKIKDEDSKREEISFSFKGPKEIKGSDLVSDKIEVVNPDNYIATINEDTELDFTLVIEKGIGYVASEELRNKTQADFIALDAFFNPVRSSVYRVENVLHEDNPDYEKIVFEITTDGQITPTEAFSNAMDAMYQQMLVFNKISTTSPRTIGDTLEDEINLNPLLKSVKELNLGVRSNNGLEKAGIEYIGELALMNENDINNLKNVGKKSVEEILNAMKEIGFPIGANGAEAYKDKLMEKIKELKENK